MAQISTTSEREDGRDLRRLLPYVGLLLFAGALYLIYQELRGFEAQDVADYLRSIPATHVGGAVALTVVNFSLLTLYDRLAMSYIGARLQYRRVALASFIGYSFSIALGHAYLTGGAVRYRLYSSWGISGTDVAKVILFCGVAFWVGYLALGGAVFAVAPFPLPEELNLPISLRPLGIIMLVLLAGYLSLSALWRRPLRIRDWSFDIPSLRLSVKQGIVAVADLTLSATILYILLPADPDLAVMHVLSAFLLAIIAGMISQVPGGLGVFDSVILLLLTPPLDPAAVLGALLAFRAIYYLLPLLVGAATFGLVEALRHRERMQVVSRRISIHLPRTVPPVLALMAFLSGVLVLIGGMLPASTERLEWLVQWVPVPAIDIAHFASSLLAVLLLLIAVGVHRRLDTAYYGCVAALAVGVLLTLLHGGWEEATVLGAVLLAALPCRAYFYRRSSLLRQPLAAGYAAVAIAVVIILAWLGFLIYQQVPYSPDLWFHSGLDADAARALRALAGVAAMLILMAVMHMIVAAPPEGVPLTDDVLPRVRRIVDQWGGASSQLALLGDKYMLFNESGTAFIMYAIRGKSWIALGDPVGDPEEREDLIWHFKSIVDRHGGRMAYYDVEQERASTYLDFGFGLFKLGERAYVELPSFDILAAANAGLLRNVRLLEQKGYSYEIVDPSVDEMLLGRLRDISTAWQLESGAADRSFSGGFFDESYLRNFPVAVVLRENRVVAFANLWAANQKREIAVDLLRFAPESPAGVVDYVFTKTMLWAKDEGFERFDLGLSAFPGMEERALAPLWSRAGPAIYQHGEHFHSSDGLRRYKEMYRPQWEPRYLAAPGGFQLRALLRDVAVLITGTSSEPRR